MSFTACLSIWMVCAFVVFAFGFVKYALRQKYADSILQQPPEKREKVIALNKKAYKYFKFMLWPTLFSLFLVPIAFYYYLDENIWIAIGFPVLLAGLVIQEYAFRKWLLAYLGT